MSNAIPQNEQCRALLMRAQSYVLTVAENYNQDVAHQGMAMELWNEILAFFETSAPALSANGEDGHAG